MLLGRVTLMESELRPMYSQVRIPPPSATPISLKIQMGLKNTSRLPCL